MRRKAFFRLVLPGRPRTLLTLASVLVAGCGASGSAPVGEAAEASPLVGAPELASLAHETTGEACPTGVATYAMIKRVNAPTCEGACPTIRDDAGHAWRTAARGGFACNGDPSLSPAPGTACGCEYTWIAKDGAWPDVAMLDREPGVYVAAVTTCGGVELPGKEVITAAAGFTVCFRPPEGTVGCGDACSPFMQRQLSVYLPDSCPTSLPLRADSPYDMELVHITNGSVQALRIRDVDRARGAVPLPTIAPGVCFDEVVSGVRFTGAPDAAVPPANAP